MKNEKKSYEMETLELAKNVQETLREAFLYEVTRLLASGGVDTLKDKQNMIFSVALDNLASMYWGNRNSKEYKNLKNF